MEGGQYLSTETERDRVAESVGLPGFVLRIGETLHPLRGVVDAAPARDPDLSVEEALGVDYVAD